MRTALPGPNRHPDQRSRPRTGATQWPRAGAISSTRTSTRSTLSQARCPAPPKRCRSSGAALVWMEKPLRDQRLIESNFGHWEGQLWTELPRIDPHRLRCTQGRHVELDPARWRKLYDGLRSGLCLGCGPPHDCRCIPRQHQPQLARRASQSRQDGGPNFEVPQDKILRLQSIGIGSAAYVLADWL